jgi:hypothetical protein
MSHAAGEEIMRVLGWQLDEWTWMKGPGIGNQLEFMV